MATSPIGIPYPVGADNNDTAAAFLNLVNWLDPVIEGSYTSAEESALAGVQLWTGRRIFNSTRGVWREYKSGAWVDADALVFNAQTGTTYTLVLTDSQGKMITLTNASPITLTIPTNASVAFPVGTVIAISQDGAGQVTIGGAGITFQATPGLKLRAQYSTATLIKKATDTWQVIGDIVA